MLYQLIEEETFKMSRIGKLPIPLPAGVTVTISPENLVTVKGKLGELYPDTIVFVHDWPLSGKPDCREDVLLQV